MEHSVRSGGLSRGDSLFFYYRFQGQALWIRQLHEENCCADTP